MNSNQVIHMTKTVYADNAATTFLSARALDAMMPYMTDQPGNASTVYAYGRNAKRALEDARQKVASAIGARPEEVYFTSGGTEADNWAIKGVAELRKNKGKHIISTEIEHHAVLHTLQYLEKQGYEVTYLKADEYGGISLDDLRGAIREDTILVTVMAANNEIGTILPVGEIGAIAREKGVLFHTDAVQAVGHIPLNVAEMNIDLLSLAGHKFKGPKGTGALFIKKGLRLPALLHGGGQERGVRSGTENVPGIVGLGAAIEEASAHLPENMEHVAAMRDRLVNGLLDIPYTRLTGDPVNRLPGTASFVFECVEGESMVLLLDQNGICASSGSACSSGSLDPSHVLMAIGLPHEVAHGSLRLSLNEDNTDGDVDYLLEKIPPVIERLRAMSPLWEEKLSPTGTK
jgi:cysteine desulfurase